MKKRTFITLFISVHLIFICALIDKQSRLMKLTYQKQAYEQKLKQLKTKQQELTNRLLTFKNHQKIKEYATNELKMSPLFLKNIKKLSPTPSPHTENPCS